LKNFWLNFLIGGVLTSIIKKENFSILLEFRIYYQKQNIYSYKSADIKLSLISKKYLRYLKKLLKVGYSTTEIWSFIFYEKNK